MEKKRSIIQVYAIIVNVVAIITFIISLTSLISAVIDRSAPLYVGGYNQTDLSSAEYDDVASTCNLPTSWLPGSIMFPKNAADGT